jgi:tRNA U34 5-methylaminomethyl-2-thiouridine-forming methyltransferase MnmC
VRFNPLFLARKKSLVRSTVAALFAFAVSFPISGYPEVHRSWLLLGPFLLACAATWDTARCLQKRWSFYHGAVLLLIYVDLMILLMISFLLIAPFSGEFL